MNNFDSQLVGRSAVFQNTLNTVSIIATTDVTLLVTGESGTGKELIAEAIHRNSPRHDGPFVRINCAALPESLVEAELFGHSKGAFTGADKSRLGRVQAAHKGTLFLDEIGELPLTVQAKLLRFLESGECQALGETAPRVVDVRVVAATNRDLFAMTQAGTFRLDLFYRLNIVPISMPALRERREDIVDLVQHFFRRLSAQHKLSEPRLTKPALLALKNYDWPGNVRELRNVCERLLILFPGKELDVNQLPFEIRQPKAATPHVGTLPDSGVHLTDVEKHMISQALEKTQGNRSHAARLLGLTRDTLLYRMKKYAIQ